MWGWDLFVNMIKITIHASYLTTKIVKNSGVGCLIPSLVVAAVFLVVVPFATFMNNLGGRAYDVMNTSWTFALLFVFVVSIIRLVIREYADKANMYNPADPFEGDIK